MLSDYIPSAIARERLLSVISADDLEAFAAWLAALRHSRTTIRSYLYAAVGYVTWARADGYHDSAALGADCLSAYRPAVPMHMCGTRSRDSGNRLCGARTYVRFLRESGVVPTEPSSLEPLIARFSDWIRRRRGNQESTIGGYQHVLRRLLRQVGDDPGLFTAEQLRTFVLTESRGFSHSKADSTVTALRMFVRFLVAHQECAESLQFAIPRLGKWSQASLPRYLEEDVVERILGSCDARTPMGARDHAVMLLLARLGLRAGDVAHLGLADLDWEHGRIRVTGKSRRSAWLPLPQDVGDAILHYLTTSRPKVESDKVFLIACAPFTPILARQVSSTAERVIRRSGAKTSSLGAHQFRHAAACAGSATACRCNPLGPSCVTPMSIRRRYTPRLMSDCSGLSPCLGLGRLHHAERGG